MGDLVNLNRFRKAKARAEKEATAAANRVLHGRAKAEKQLDRLSAEKTSRDLDGHRIMADPDTPPE